MKRRTKEGECTTTKIMNTLRWAFSLKKKLFPILKFAFFCTLEHSRRKIQTCSLVFDFFCTLQWGVLSELLQQNESESALSKIDQLCLEIHFTTNEHTHTVEPRYSKKKMKSLQQTPATSSLQHTPTYNRLQQRETKRVRERERKGQYCWRLKKNSQRNGGDANAPTTSVYTLLTLNPLTLNHFFPPSSLFYFPVQSWEATNARRMRARDR